MGTESQSMRRAFLQQTGAGFGWLALSRLLAAEQPASPANPAGPGEYDPASPLRARRRHFHSPVRSVIWLFMHGGPSQVDTWDFKPELAKRDGQELQGFDQSTGFFAGLAGPIMRSPFAFSQYGESGTWASEILPHLSRCVDELAFIHSCHTTANNHSPAQFEISGGLPRLGLPCLGSWVTYGLGTENQNLPAFIVMYDAQGRGLPKSRSIHWGAGFLPGVFQGAALSPTGSPREDLQSPTRPSPRRQRELLDFVQKANRRHAEEHHGDSELAARIESFELAYRMQSAAPEALDISRETALTQRLYGMENPRSAPYGKQLLTARRLVERGVRFIQVYSGGFANHDCWDGHDNLDANHRQFAAETDQPIAGFIQDLKARGLLDSTLVICCGEFGRLPLVQKGGTGRDHNPHAFTVWFAGGGVRMGVHFGSTDELGNRAVEGRVSIHDLHATILHLIGIDHEKLTYRHNGRGFRLTDVEGEVVRAVVPQPGV